jgi:uncharacterized protein with von Willebrand factor type A (vWA) domain
MFLNFFHDLRQAKIPVTLKEYLALMEGLDRKVIDMKVDDFYYLSRTALVKDERNLDKFDRVFAHAFKGMEGLDPTELAQIPEDWLKALTEKYLTEEEKKQIESLGGWDKLMEELKKRLEEQKKRHEGGNKAIGTGGTSPFGAYGYNPEGIRMGQDKGRHGKAVKVWDKREYKNLDDSVELGTRNIKIALRRLRKWAREGALTELDLPETIRQQGEGAHLLRHRRLDGCAHQAVRGAVLRRAHRIQAHGFLLLPQLRLRKPVEGQSPPSQRKDTDLGRTAQIPARLQGRDRW